MFNSEPLKNGKTSSPQINFNSRVAAFENCSCDYGDLINDTGDTLARAIGLRDSADLPHQLRPVVNRQVRDVAHLLKGIHLQAADHHIDMGDEEGVTSHENAADNLDEELKKDMPFSVEGGKTVEGQKVQNRFRAGFKKVWTRLANPSSGIYGWEPSAYPPRPTQRPSEEHVEPTARTVIDGPNPTSFQDWNTPFQENYRRLARARDEYLGLCRQHGIFPSKRAQVIFGIGAYQDHGPAREMLGSSLDRYNKVLWVPKRAASRSFEGNEDAYGRVRSVSTETLLRDPDFKINGQAIGYGVGDRGRSYVQDPLGRFMRGHIARNQRYVDMMSTLENHPALQPDKSGRILWTPEARGVVMDAIGKFRQDSWDHFHGDGITMPNGERQIPLMVSNEFSRFADRVGERLRPVADTTNEALARRMLQAYKRATVVSDIHSVLNRHTAPLSTVYDTTLHRMIGGTIKDEEPLLAQVLTKHFDLRNPLAASQEHDYDHVRSILEYRASERTRKEKEQGVDEFQLQTEPKIPAVRTVSPRRFQAPS